MSVSELRQSDALPVLRDVADLRRTVADWRTQGLRVGLVPTMGALHAGHLSLVRTALERADRVIATIFVNPTQFGPGEDFSTYPRQEAEDAARLAEVGCRAVYAPDAESMYPAGFATRVTVEGVSKGLCGDHRPGHFEGVATVVTKLLLRALPDMAVFGEKDYQQLQVIRRLVTDLDIPVEIVGGATVRAEDGLALSSRNAYLTEAERTIAPALFRVLSETAATLATGAPAAPQLADARARLTAAGFAIVEYLDLRDPETLAPLPALPSTGVGRLLAAVRLGSTRLIDNVPVIRSGPGAQPTDRGV
ncbi:pantoate--beta-alanine ligase [Roseospira marina]|uniref:Pantothenate synthetase n=1 Tax=Roseospira marina TaxID=140057 RepID=A0A5M6IHU0_9PROT|nr:pantoate--beta-alanine ligase [Roseospira marina]KAA5607205.1 pantoate--beta-alanine ligase [Roseospira marina]MBB4312645.1 pantoate--beta-alanine ligase [Roseospira marina]MBB5085339.1 pantoate--beta-alanine ligase [Roseospira marina]